MNKYTCSICGFVYNEELGLPEQGINPGTKWEDIKDNFVCPICGAPHEVFEGNEVTNESSTTVKQESTIDITHNDEQLNYIELSIMCSNFAKGCEKQYMFEEQEEFKKLANYFKVNATNEEEANMDILRTLVDNDLKVNYVNATNNATNNKDRGALRALTWSQKVTMILNTLLNRYDKENDKMLENTNVYVCTICGYIHIGENAPELCPICKVKSSKFEKVVIDNE